MSRAREYWLTYRKVTDFPRAGKDAAERRVGYIVYVLCLLLACGLLLSMFLQESQTYINYQMSGGDYMRSTRHRPPDLVVCPNRPLWPQRMYEVHYDEEVIRALNLTNDVLNLITKSYHSSCNIREPCGDLEQMCRDTPFSSFCRALEVWVTKTLDQLKKVNVTELKSRETLAPYFAHTIKRRKTLVLQKVVRSGQLHMLWLAILSGRYEDIQARHQALEPGRELVTQAHLIYCYYYNSSGMDVELNEQCAKKQQDFWLGTTLCGLVRGSWIQETRSPYIGFTNNRFGTPFRYWVGNLESTTLTEDLLMTNSYGTRKNRAKWRAAIGELPLVTAVGHYSMIKWSQETASNHKCPPQPLIRGIRLSPEHCEESSNSEPAWYYDLEYQKNPLLVVWIYPQTLRTIEKYESFTAYTQFQVGAGLLSCFVGFSFLQVIELLLSLGKKIKLVTKKFIGGVQIMSIIVAIILTFLLTGLDLYWYLGSRYTTMFSHRHEDLEFPVVQICSDRTSPYLFINTTKLAEHGASVNFYAFMRFAAWQIQPSINLAYRVHKENGTYVTEIKEWMRRNWFPSVKVNTTCVGSRREPCLRERYPWWDYVFFQDRASRNIPRRINITQHVDFMENFLLTDLTVTAEALNKSEPTIADFMEFFSLDPKRLISCSMRGRPIEDCGKFGRYFFEMGAHEFCLSLQIRKEQFPNSADGTFLDNSFKVSYDSREYKLHSDYGSYYGPGVEEGKERDEGFNYCEGKNRKSGQRMAGNWWRTTCFAGRSWKLKIAHPSWAEDYIQIQHPVMGLIDHELHTLSIQSSFSTKMPLDKDRCTPTESLTCQFPKEETTAVFKAMQYHIWCGCLYCAHQETKFLGDMKEILREKPVCCTPRQYLGCLKNYLSAAEWDSSIGNYKPNVNFTVANNFMVNIGDFTDSETLKRISVGELGKWLKQIEWLDNSTASRLAEWTRKCYREPCEKRSFTLLSYHNEPTNNEVVNVTIVFESNIAVGSEEIDRLDPAQLLGILLCSYSVTIGIGVIGLCEVALIALGRRKGKKKEKREEKVSTTIHEHLFRGLSSIIQFDDIAASPTEEKQDVQEDNWSTRTIEPASDEEADQSESRKEVDSAKIDAEVMKVEPFEDDTADSAGEIDFLPEEDESEEIETYKAKDREGEQVEKIEKDESTGKKKASEKTKRDGEMHVFLLAALLLGTFCVLGLLVYLFASLETEYSADMTVSPFYEKPSVVLCVETPEDATATWEALEQGRCSRNGEKKQSCAILFDTFIHARSELYCFMMDTTGSFSKLDRHVVDLAIAIPIGSPSVLIYVNGLNGSVAGDINPYFQWHDKNVSIRYTINAYQYTSSCVSTVSNVTCEACNISSAIVSEKEIICCSSNKAAPKFTADETCSKFEFGVSYAPSDRGRGSMKTLTLKAASDFLIFYEVSFKQNIPMLISISGGFISSFTEITFLNLLAITFFLLWKKLVKQPRGSKVKPMGERMEEKPNNDVVETQE